jgi:hypothetical protein
MVTDFDLLSSNINRYLVTPLNAFGLGGFLFDIEGDTTAHLSTEITDHYLEDNSAVQDHIAVRPKKITLKGYVGELTFKPDGEGNTFVQKAVQKLTVLSSILPTLSKGATQLKSAYESGNLTQALQGNVTLETINKTIDYWALVKNLAASNNKQQQAYQYFKALMEQKILMSVQTPFEFMSNMAVESIVATQSEVTKYISDFTITLKQIRTVSILNVDLKSNQYVTDQSTTKETYQGRAAPQSEPVTQVGNVPGLEALPELVGVVPLPAVLPE